MLFQDPTRIDWEVVMLDLIDQVRTQPEMDPVLRVALLRKVLELGLEGSEPLQAALGGFKNLVDQADVDVERAVDGPREPRGRSDAAQGGGVPPVPARPDGRCARMRWRAGRTVQRLLAGRPQAVGWLAREPEGWRVRTGAVLPAAGTLRIAVPGEDGHGAWKKIGAIDQGRPRLIGRRRPGAGRRAGRSSSSPRTRAAREDSSGKPE